MSQLQLSTAKIHCSVSEGFADHDTLIQSFIDTAESWMGGHLRRDLNAEYPDGWPPELIQVVRMITALYYLNREALAVGISVSPLSDMSVKDLLADHRNFAS